MKCLIAIALLMISATAWSAGKQYYDYPDATVLNSTDRLLIFQGNSGSKNITGAKLRSEILGNFAPNISSGPLTFDQVMLAGSDYLMSLQVVNAAYVPIDITGYQYAAQFRSGTAPSGTLFATYSTSVIDGPTGKLRVTLSRAQTSTLSGSSGLWDLLQLDNLGKATYLLRGTAIVWPSTTEAP